jgi:hypothetical protein
MDESSALKRLSWREHLGSQKVVAREKEERTMDELDVWVPQMWRSDLGIRLEAMRTRSGEHCFQVTENMSVVYGPVPGMQQAVAAYNDWILLRENAGREMNVGLDDSQWRTVSYDANVYYQKYAALVDGDVVVYARVTVGGQVAFGPTEDLAAASGYYRDLEVRLGSDDNEDDNLLPF